jgi:branched-chain amino acid transport system ATP-binding protein
MIQLADIHASRSGVSILHGVTFAVAAGEAVALFGRNGMGKTTTLDCIAGVLQPTAGTLSVLGHTTPRKPHAAVRAGLGYVPEHRGIFPRLTIGENLAVSRTHGTPWTLPRLLTLFPPLQGRLHERAGQLSGGQQQMVAIARALSGDPSVLLLDEPTAGLAPLVVDAIANALRDINQAGVALLVVEQTMAVAGRLATRFLFMTDGRIQADVPRADLEADPGLFDRHLGIAAARVESSPLPLREGPGKGHAKPQFRNSRTQ